MAGKVENRREAIGVLRWYAASGVQDISADTPANAYAVAPPAPAKPPPPAPAPAPQAPALETKAATSTPPLIPDAGAQIAADAKTLEELRAALETWDGCALKQSARNLVFADGSPEAKVMFLGEAPGRDEDMQGKPFVGRAGQLLDNMLAAIGLDRSSVYISNMIFWRPPGNRTPTPEEQAQCWPFVERHIALVAPKVLVLTGAVAAGAVLARREGVTKLRGQWFEVEIGGHKAQALVMFHPAYLLRQPGQKKLAWRDLLSLQAKLEAFEGKQA